MSWPPQVGEMLPRFDEPVGIEEKLRTYSLAVEHVDGGPKAKGFKAMLGIDLSSIDFLEQEIRTGISHTPVSAVVPRKAGSFRCTVQFRIAGPGRYSHRTASIRTGWEVTGPDERPRMTNAFLRGRHDR